MFPYDAQGYNFPNYTDVVNMWSNKSSTVIFSILWPKIVFTGSSLRVIMAVVNKHDIVVIMFPFDLMVMVDFSKDIIYTHKDLTSSI